MPDFQYLDFDLDINRVGDAYHVEVTHSPAGAASGDFALPFSELELENFLLKLGGARQSVRRIESSQMDVAKQFGGRLYDTVFTKGVGDCLTRSLTFAQDHNEGLRVRLHLDGAPTLAALPWEFLYNSSGNSFLTLSADTPIVRYLDIQETLDPLPVTPPLRILAMIANAPDYPQLAVEQEWQNLQKALADPIRRGAVQLERLEIASLAALQSKLQTNQYHILHFVSHGSFDEHAQDGELVLQDPTGRGKRVSAQTLGYLLHDQKSLRLVVLNACEGARSSPTDPFGGVAQTLVQQGIPAVIAMQFEISDGAAALFAGAFYQAIASGYPVDAALAEARKSMMTDDTQEWGTPVLFLRAPDGKIFDIHGGAVAPPPPLLPSGLNIPPQLLDLARKPITWLATLGILTLLLWLFVFRPAPGVVPPPTITPTLVPSPVATLVPTPDVELGQIDTASQVIPGPVEDTYIPIGKRDEFKSDENHLFVVVEMKRLPQNVHLDLQLSQIGGFERIFPGNSRNRDVSGVTDAWWYFDLVPREICAIPGAICPGTFHADILVNNASVNKEAVFSILPPATIATVIVPSETPTAPTVPTTTPSPSATSTPTPSPTVTFTPTATQTDAIVCAPVLLFVHDDTVPDRTVIDPGATFIKTWQIRNAGNCAWDSGYTLNVADSGGMGGDRSVFLPALPIQGTGRVSVSLNAPTTPGVHRETWIPHTAQNIAFGKAIWVEIVVSPTPTPTLTATATSTETVTPTATETPLVTNTPTPLFTPTLLANAPSIVTHFVIPEEQLTPALYTTDPAFFSGDPAQTREFFRVTHIAYGDLGDGTHAYDIRVTVKNPSLSPLRLQVDRKFFSLEDNLGRTANLLYFCCATDETFLDPGQEREIQLVFASRPEWGGKGGESQSNFRVQGFLPVVNASWHVPLPVAAE